MSNDWWLLIDCHLLAVGDVSCSGRGIPAGACTTSALRTAAVTLSVGAPLLRLPFTTPLIAAIIAAIAGAVAAPLPATVSAALGLAATPLYRLAATAALPAVLPPLVLPGLIPSPISCPVIAPIGAPVIWPGDKPLAVLSSQGGCLRSCCWFLPVSRGAPESAVSTSARPTRCEISGATECHGC